MSYWEAEVALSSRGTCKECAKQIDKSDVKLRWRESTKSPWWHIACALACASDSNAETEPLADVTDVQNFDHLTTTHQDILTQALGKPSKSKSKATTKAKSTTRSTTKPTAKSTAKSTAKPTAKSTTRSTAKSQASKQNKRKREESDHDDSGSDVAVDEKTTEESDNASGSDHDTATKHKAKKQKTASGKAKTTKTQAKNSKQSSNKTRTIVLKVSTSVVSVVVDPKTQDIKSTSCSCQGYKFSKAKPKSCKHCQEVEQNPDDFEDAIADALEDSSGGATKCGALPKPTLNKISLEAKNLASKTVDELKEMCKRNAQTTTGTKKELIQRVAEGEVLGRIPRCPSCSGGRPKFNLQTGIYTCPGFMDDDQFIRCSWRAKFADLERLAWK